MGSVPEGDTVWLTAHRLHQALAGRPLTRSDLRVPRLATADLTGREVHGVLARGKHILARFEGDLTLHSHLRMDGSWRLSQAGARWSGGPAHQVRAVLANTDWQALGYRVHDLALVPTTEEDRLVGHLGPDLLGPDWDPDLAARRLAAQPDRAIGEALLDQRNLAGIGNLYKAEILFLHRTNPWVRTGDVADLAAVAATAHRLLRANRDHPEQSTTGSMRPGEQHWVYGRAGRPCRRCGAAVQRADQGTAPYARVTFWCPACQPEPADRGTEDSRAGDSRAGDSDSGDSGTGDSAPED
jgi:endonuclease-8